MQSEICKQFENSDKNTKIKHPESINLFAGCFGGNLLEISIDSKSIVYDFGKIFNNAIVSMAKTHDNKS